MAEHARAFEGWDEDDLHDGLTPGERVVEVELESWFQELQEDEDSEPWCVDHGDAITVMRTHEIQRRVARGALPTDTKVWRDGEGCWMRIFEQPYLDPSEGDRPTIPERSHIRPARARRADLPSEPDLEPWAEPAWEPRAAPLPLLKKVTLFSLAFVFGVGAGGALCLPFVDLSQPLPAANRAGEVHHLAALVDLAAQQARP